MPAYRWGERLLVRVCMQHYVDDVELQRALEGLSESRVATGFL